MPNQEKIIELIINYINQNRKLLNVPNELIPDMNTKIFGSGGILDSIGLVHLIVFLEKNLKNLGCPKVVLVSSKTMSSKNSPFQDVNSLASFVVEKLKT